MKGTPINKVVVCLVLVSNQAFSAYSPDLIVAQNYANTLCSKFDDFNVISNSLDSTEFFLCSYGETIRQKCPVYSSEGSGEFNVKNAFFYTIDKLCDWPPLNISEANDGINSGNFVGFCDKSTICDCRDNLESETKIHGECKCSGIFDGTRGFFLDYSTCHDRQPTCQTKIDINGIDKSQFDIEEYKCYVGTGSSFSDESGTYEYTSNCYEN